jgi:hypothetical protein
MTIPVRLCNHADGFPSGNGFKCPHCGFDQSETVGNQTQLALARESLPVLALEDMSKPEVTIDEDDSQVNYKARKFVDYIRKGDSPGKAAHKIGTSLHKISRSQETKEAIAALLGTFALEDEVRKQLAKASLNKLLLESINSDSIEGAKLALAVATQMSKETGNEPMTPGVTIDLGSLGDIIKDISLEAKPSDSTTT